MKANYVMTLTGLDGAKYYVGVDYGDEVFEPCAIVIKKIDRGYLVVWEGLPGQVYEVIDELQGK